MNEARDSFFKAVRSEEATELVARNPNAFILLYIIASRARRTSLFNRYNLEPGEALIGDFQSYGMSERNYRTAKQQLQKFGFATFKATNKGTVAKIINTRVFDINIEQPDEPNDETVTSDRRTGDGQPTTNKNDKKGKNGKMEKEVLEIWNAYPLKKAKPEGLKAIRRALQKMPFDELLARTKRFAAARGGDLSFCPNPATWFNQERYNDDPATWRNPSATSVQKPIVHTNGNF